MPLGRLAFACDRCGCQSFWNTCETAVKRTRGSVANVDSLFVDVRDDAHKMKSHRVSAVQAAQRVAGPHNEGVRTMRNISDTFAPILATLLLSSCSDDNAAPLDVRSPCDTFVSQYAPQQTPDVRNGASGLELVVSLTPAPNADARAILDAAEHGPLHLSIHPGMDRIHVLRREAGNIVVSVFSEADAKRVARLLCF